MPLTTQSNVETIDAETLAERLGNLPVSWVREQTRSRVPVADRIPHLKLGKYVRFEWGSAALNEWIARRRKVAA